MFEYQPGPQEVVRKKFELPSVKLLRLEEELSYLEDELRELEKEEIPSRLEEVGEATLQLQEVEFLQT